MLSRDLKSLLQAIPKSDQKTLQHPMIPATRSEELNLRLKVDAEIRLLHEDIKTRRVVPSTARLNQISHLLTNERMYGDDSWKKYQHRWELAALPFTSVSSPSSYLLKALEKLGKMHELVQQLPTTPNLPVTKQDRIIRAIVAVLRTHEVEGIEQVEPNGHEKEVGTNEKKNTAAAAAEGIDSLTDALAPSGPFVTDFDPVEPETISGETELAF